MSGSICCLLGRLPANGKFWLKRACVAAIHLGGDTPPVGPDGCLLADIRIEDGRIRALLPAGESPCCAPGLGLDGGAVEPLSAGGRVAPGEPADLALSMPNGRRVVLRAGRMVPVDGGGESRG